MDDESLREKIGLNAAFTIKNGHTWDIYGKDVSKLYQELINEKK